MNVCEGSGCLGICLRASLFRLLFERLEQRLVLIAQQAYLLLLRQYHHALLLDLLLVLDLLIVGEKKSALKLAVQLTNFLVNSKQHLLLTHDLDGLKTV